ncbi:unnamed protein product, partial [Ectocarpus sp. 12 AP-2014]
MRKKLIINLQQYLYFKWAAGLFAFSFFFGVAANSIGYVVFLLLGLLNFTINFKSYSKAILKEKIILILGLFFLIIFVRELMNFQSIAIDSILMNSAFILIPVVVELNYKKIIDIYPFVLKAFVLGSCINVVINLFFAVYRGIIEIENGINFWYFTYDFFAEPFGIQPIYLACFYVFSIFILIQHKIFNNGVANYLLIFLLLVGVFLLAARNAILALIIIAPILYVIKNGFDWKKILLILSLFIVSGFFGLQNPVVKNRVFKFNQKGNFYSGINLRLEVWKSGIEASKENLFFGSGKAKGNILLLEEYKNKNLEIPLRDKYHVHNQYLQTFLNYGLIGLTTLVSIFFWLLVLMYRRRNYLALSWIVLFASACVTES